MTSRLAPTPLLRLLSAALLAALVVVAYGGAIDAPFVFDDRVHIAENPLLLRPDAWFDRAAESALGASPPQSGALRSRFLAVASFAVDARLRGVEPRAFRATNLLVHLAATWTLFALALRISRAPLFEGAAVRRDALPLALLGAALFALHPLQTQAVTYVVQRMTSLAGLFGLLAVFAHVVARQQAARARRIAAAVGTFLALVAAMATKESGVAYPLLVGLVDFALVPREPWRRRLGALAPALAALALTPLLVAWTISSAGSSWLEGIDRATRTGGAPDRWTYLLTQLDVQARYLKLTLWPTGQSVDHAIAWARGPLEPRLLAVAALLAVLVAASIRALRGGAGRDATWRLVGLGGLWFLVAQAVESSLVPIADPMVEHRLYLPLAGAALAASAGAALVARGRRARLAAAIAGVAVVAALTAATRARNEVWRDELALWESAARVAPDSARASFNVGALRAARGELEVAASALRRALELDPSLAPAELNLGTLAALRGDLREAERRIARALELDPSNWIAAVNLGDLRRRSGRLDEARRLYAQAAGAAPHERIPRDRLASLPPAAGARDTLRDAPQNVTESSAADDASER